LEKDDTLSPSIGLEIKVDSPVQYEGVGRKAQSLFSPLRLRGGRACRAVALAKAGGVTSFFIITPPLRGRRECLIRLFQKSPLKCYCKQVEKMARSVTGLY
jgi:hypothetical protein